MASTMTAAHAPAVNHPSQRTAGFAATSSPAAGHFTTDAVRHGNETVRSTLATAAGTISSLLPGWAPGMINPATGKQEYIPNGAAGVPGIDPSYTFANGVYTFNGNSSAGGSTSASTLAGAMAAWLAQNPAVNPATTTGGTTDTPFQTLASLLTSLSGQTPVAATVPDDTAATSVPTTSSPSLVIPTLLVLLACGVGYWWWTQHHKKHAAAK